MWIVYWGHKLLAAYCLVQLELNYSPTLESEKDAKITDWKACQLVHWLVRNAAETCPA
jgi:hypothetical protein